MLTTKDALTLRFVLMAREHAQGIGRRMREHREALGLTQREVAEQLPSPIDGNYISRWERGAHKPDDETLDLIAVALKTTTAKLLSDPPKGGTPDLSKNSRPQLDRIEADVAAIRVELATLTTQLADLQKSLRRRSDTGASKTQSRKAK